MFFYRVEAEIVNAKEFQTVSENNDTNQNNARGRAITFRRSEVWLEFKEFASQHSNEHYRKSGKEIFTFCAGIKAESRIIIGVISQRAVDAMKCAKEYIANIDAEFTDFSAEETTLKSISSLLNLGDRNDLISDDDAVLEMFDLDEVINSYGSQIIFEETIIDEIPQKQRLIGKSDSLLCSETLTPEIERIYEVPSGKACAGHPVHYMLQTDNPEVRDGMLHVLLSALYNNNRIRSRRYCTIRLNYVDNHRRRDIDWDKYDMLYKSCDGGVMVVDYNCIEKMESEYANPGEENISRISSIAKKHKNDVLTILCLSRSCEKTKNAFLESLGMITMVSMTEDVVFGEKAKKFLRALARKHEVPADKALMKTITDMEKGFLASDLFSTFDEWYGKKLKTKIYPQYADFETSCRRAAGKKAKGSAYSELENMIGLTEAKSVINQALDFYKAQKLYRDKGFIGERPAMHMAFTGNPGTAKTSVARLFAQIMKDNGLLSEGRLYEVGRADLVGMYVGWTAQIVKQKFRTAKGSVLFIDEAYSLVDDKDGLFGDEAINTIVQEMENMREDMVVIFAGYPDKMKSFLNKNPGLRSRIAFHVPFEDYNEEELYQITELLAKKKDVSVAADARDKLTDIYKTAMKSEDFGNGRFARNLLEKAIMKQASRLVAMDSEAVTKNDVCTLLAEDFEPPAEVKNMPLRIGFAS